MSNFYAIKDTTLTALGDAVRNKIGIKYISVDEIPVPLFDISFDTREMEEYVIQNGIRRYTVPFNLIEMFGDERTKITKLYVSGNYECYVGPGFTYWPGELSICFSGNRRHQIAGGSDYQLNGEINSTIEIPAHYWNDSENTYIELRGNDWVFTDKPTYDGWYKANIKIWAMASDGSYLVYNSFTPLEMVDKINELMTIPNEALNITGNCQYRFAYGGNDWFIEQAGDKITTDGITEAGNMFYSSQVAEIPFDINVNINSITNFNNCFGGMSNLEKAPYIIGGEKTPPTSAYSGTIQINSLFNANYRLKEVPNDFFWKLISNKEYWDVNRSLSTKSFDYLFYNCYSLRELPDISMLGGAWTSSYSTIYANCLNGSTSLNKAENYPVCGKFSSNAMSYLAPSCFRLKDFTFMVNEGGTPKIAEWKNQTLDFSSAVGWVPNSYSRNLILNYNSGITADKEVIDDATYQALKDDPDWFSVNINYSRYNHDSAVNTINSLPDCSATGTNTIKFQGQAGALTDGGAINTLTEEEIAVATAKGWTVSLV